MKKQVVAEWIKKYNSEEMKHKRYKMKMKKLHAMYVEHGAEKTAFAAGLELSTLLVYLRSKNYIAISDNCIDQAEWVFDNYSE